MLKSPGIKKLIADNRNSVCLMSKLLPLQGKPAADGVSDFPSFVVV